VYSACTRKSLTYSNPIVDSDAIFTDNVDRLAPAGIDARMRTIGKMLPVGGVFVAVGDLLIGAALFLEPFEFHPLSDSFFREHAAHSLAEAGPTAPAWTC